MINNFQNAKAIHTWGSEEEEGRVHGHLQGWAAAPCRVPGQAGWEEEGEEII